MRGEDSKSFITQKIPRSSRGIFFISERQIDLFLRTVLQSLEQRILVEEALAGEVGNGAGHPEDAVVGAGREAQRLVGGPQELFSGGGHPADAPYLPGGELGVAAHILVAGSRVPLGLDGPGSKDLFPQLGAAQMCIRDSSSSINSESTVTG